MSLKREMGSVFLAVLVVGCCASIATQAKDRGSKTANQLTRLWDVPWPHPQQQLVLESVLTGHEAVTWGLNDCFGTDLATGKEIWRVQNYQVNSMAKAPDGRLFIMTNNGVLLSINPSTGRYNVQDSPLNKAHVAPKTTGQGELVVTGRDGEKGPGVALLWETEHKKAKWRFVMPASDAEIYQCPVVTPEFCFVTAKSPSAVWCYVLDIRTGKMLNHFHFADRLSSFTPAGPGAVLMAGAGRGNSLKMMAGSEYWLIQLGNGEKAHVKACKGMEPGSMVVKGGVLYGFLWRKGRITARDLGTGKTLWRSPRIWLPGPFYTGTRIHAADGFIVANLSGMMLNAYDSRTGHLLFHAAGEGFEAATGKAKAFLLMPTLNEVVLLGEKQEKPR